MFRDAPDDRSAEIQPARFLSFFECTVSRFNVRIETFFAAGPALIFGHAQAGFNFVERFTFSGHLADSIQEHVVRARVFSDFQSATVDMLFNKIVCAQTVLNARGRMTREAATITKG